MWKFLRVPQTTWGRLLASQLFILGGLVALDLSERPVLPAAHAQSSGCDICGGIVRPGCYSGEPGSSGDTTLQCCGDETTGQWMNQADFTTSCCPACSCSQPTPVN